MTAVWLRFRSDLRSRLAAVVSLAVIVGIVGGVVIAALAGARRTESAYPRFIVASRSLDLVVSPSGRDRAEMTREVARLPDIAQLARVSVMLGSVRAPSGTSLAFPDVFPLASVDGRFGTEINRLKIISGHAADPSDPFEAVVTLPVAQRLGIGVGDTVDVGVFGDTTFADVEPAPPVRVHVVGVSVAPGEFQPLAGGYLPVFHLTPAFYRSYRTLFSPADDALVIRLRDGQAGMPRFQRELHAIGGRLRGGIEVSFTQAQQTRGVQDAAGTQAVALRVLALLVAVAGAAIFGQALGRQTFLESAEHPALRALGFAPRQLIAVGVLRAAVIGAVGAVVAVVISVLLSPLSPVGLARAAEPSPGVAVDVPAEILGVAGLLVAVVLISLLPAWRSARRAAGRVQAPVEVSRVAGLVARLGGRPSAAAGIRMALEPGRGRTAVPVRTTIVGTTLGLMALAAALVAGASLSRLATTPALSGWNWDILVGSFDDTQPVPKGRLSRLESTMQRDPEIAGFAIGTLPGLRVNGVGVTVIAMDSLKGSVTPSLADGRLPSGADEIALGSDTMREAGVGIGDEVRVRGGGVEGPRVDTRMTVVGRTVMWTFFTQTRPGEAAAVTLDWLLSIQPHAVDSPAFFIRLAPGVDESRVFHRLQAIVPTLFEFPRVESNQVSTLAGMQDLPLELAGVMALLAVATLSHTLVTSIRRRRRDLAVLKTVGFSRRQVSAAVAWQSSTIAAIALVAGIPVGIVAARWGWSLLAEQYGVVPSPAVPLLAVLLIVPATLLVANLVAAIPARLAARTHPAQVLRSE
jgi:FtsX-like permease family